MKHSRFTDGQIIKILKNVASKKWCRQREAGRCGSGPRTDGVSQHRAGEFVTLLHQQCLLHSQQLAFVDSPSELLIRRLLRVQTLPTGWSMLNQVECCTPCHPRARASFGDRPNSRLNMRL